MTTQENLTQMQATGAAHSTYAARKEELLAQKDALARQAADLQAQLDEHEAKAKAEFISDLKASVLATGMTTAEVIAGLSQGGVQPSKLASAPRASAGCKLPPKYADGKGYAWTGRGLMPRWLVAALAGGAELESFRVARG